VKKTLSIIVLGILVLSGLGAIATPNTTSEPMKKTESIQFSQPILQEQENYITIDLPEATGRLMKTGKPELPMVTKVYTFPRGTQITSIDISYSSTYELPISKPIKPTSEPQILSIHHTPDVIETNNLETYPDISRYPEHRYSYRTGAGLQGDHHVLYLSVHLYPVQYVPAANTISYAERATIDITYVPAQNLVGSADDYDLLIITPATFTESLQPLVEYKNSEGIATKMVTLDDIPEQGDDTQEDIKYYIKEAIETWGITYVLLVGSGVKDAELFPVRYAWVPSGSYEDNFPSDLYYADIYDANMSFSTWDANDNGKYAEYPFDMTAVDLYPDVYLARLPCNDEREVTTVVAKILLFEEHNSMMNTIVQIGGDTFPGDPEGVYEGEYANEAVLTKLPGYSSTKLWGSTGELTKTNIIKGFYDGADFVDFSGHGSYLSWATHPPEDESTWIPEGVKYTGFLYIDIDWLFNNKKLPVVFFNACSNNKFSEHPDCLGWKVLSKADGGGIASYGASGIGYGSYGTSEIERVMGWMEVHTFEGLYNDKILGKVWGDCLTEYTNSFVFEDFDYKTVLELALFGDPTLAIEDGPNPDNIPDDNPLFFKIMERLALRWYALLERLSTILP
jgi:hypothetical protein